MVLLLFPCLWHRVHLLMEAELHMKLGRRETRGNTDEAKGMYDTDRDAGEDLEGTATKTHFPTADIIRWPPSKEQWHSSSFIHEVIFNPRGILQHHQSRFLSLICPTGHL